MAVFIDDGWVVKIREILGNVSFEDSAREQGLQYEKLDCSHSNPMYCAGGRKLYKYYNKEGKVRYVVQSYDKTDVYEPGGQGPVRSR